MIWRTTLLAAVALPALAFGQSVAPAASGGSGNSGSLHYTVSVSDIVDLNRAVANDLTQSGSVSVASGYNSMSERHPFGLLYSGGGLWTTQTGSRNSTFQNLQLTQGFVWRKWTLNLADSANYLPEAPTTGASGIPGVGDLTGTLGFGTFSPGTVPDQSILSTYAPRISNAVSSGLAYRIDGKTSLTGSGSFGLLRFVNSDGLDGTQESASVGVSHRLNARNAIGANYVYSRFAYDLSGFSMVSNGCEVTFTRRWSSRLTSDIGFGPQWTHGSNATQLPDRTSVAGSAGLTYTLGSSSANLRYIRGVTGGSGVSEGSMTDSVQVGISRVLARVWTLALMGAFARNDALQTVGVTTTKYGGAQLSRHLGGHASAYLSYTAMAQSAPNASFVNVLNGLTHVFGAGFEFSPRETRLKGR